MKRVITITLSILLISIVGYTMLDSYEEVGPPGWEEVDFTNDRPIKEEPGKIYMWRGPDTGAVAYCECRKVEELEEEVKRLEVENEWLWDQWYAASKGCL